MIIEVKKVRIPGIRPNTIRKKLGLAKQEHDDYIALLERNVGAKEIWFYLYPSDVPMYMCQYFTYYPTTHKQIEQEIKESKLVWEEV